MAEPAASTLAGAAAGSVAVTLTGTVLGAQLDALVAGLAAAFLVTIMLPAIDDRAKAFAAVLLSSLLAGYGSPVAVPWVLTHVSGIDGANVDNIRMLLAVVIGSTGPIGVPIALRRIRIKAEEVSP